MSLRVLMPIATYPDAAPSAALPRALDMAATLGAHVVALVHEVDIQPLSNPVAEFLLDIKAQADAAEALSRQRGLDLAREIANLAARVSVPLTLEKQRTSRPWGEAVAVVARTYDLTMLVCQSDSPAHQLLQEEVVFGSGGPVIIFPTHDTPSHLETIAVAWDGSRAAARALHDALPLLPHARQVCLLTCEHDKPIGKSSIDGVSHLLSAHGIDVKHEPLAFASEIGATLQEGALAADAGMLVMGAYGHSRAREIILGGATASALRSPRLPLFMSH